MASMTQPAISASAASVRRASRNAAISAVDHQATSSASGGVIGSR